MHLSIKATWYFIQQPEKMFSVKWPASHVFLTLALLCFACPMQAEEMLTQDISTQDMATQDMATQDMATQDMAIQDMATPANTSAVSVIDMAGENTLLQSMQKPSKIAGSTHSIPQTQKIDPWKHMDELVENVRILLHKMQEQVKLVKQESWIAQQAPPSSSTNTTNSTDLDQLGNIIAQSSVPKKIQHRRRK
jgi:hypothetical protein